MKSGILHDGPRDRASLENSFATVHNFSDCKSLASFSLG